MEPTYIVRTYRHLLIPTFDEPANQGSKMNTQRNVVADFNPSRKLGLSCKRSPFLNQCTVCFSLFPAFIMTWPKHWWLTALDTHFVLKTMSTWEIERSSRTNGNLSRQNFFTSVMKTTPLLHTPRATWLRTSAVA